jgi:DNA polymerase-4
MKSMGLFTGADLKNLSERDLIKHFGKTGKFFFKIVRGIDDREVQSNRETKSIAAEDTFAEDLITLEEMLVQLERIVSLAHDRLIRNQLKARTITLKVKYHDFQQITRSKTFEQPVNDLEAVFTIARQLLFATDTQNVRIRLLGISFSNFDYPQTTFRKIKISEQLNLDF